MAVLVTALEDINEYAEQQRQRLETVIRRMITHLHKVSDCPNPFEDCVRFELENALSVCDQHTLARGAPWHVVVAGVARWYETVADQLEGK